MAETVRFTFEGREIAARPGLSLAAALTEAGERGLRETKSGGVRGMFCGMGVCQDCLVEVDGRPSQRACMTKAAEGMAVRRQAAFPALEAPAGPPPRKARTEAPDVLVIGGGAAGLSATIAARAEGAEVLVLDERPVPGGQYYKQAAGPAPLDHQQREGAALVARAREAGARILAGAEVWGAFEGPVIHATTPDGALTVRPRALVVAAGAYERPLMVPGWDLPGVMTTGAAQTLWRSYRALPGHRVAIAGNGPLNLQVARELMRGGAEVALIAEAAAAPWASPGAGLRMLRADPRLTAAGAGTLAWLMARGVRPRFGARLEAVERVGGALRVHVRRAPGTRESVEVDALCMNGGFHPQNEVLRLLGAAMGWDAAREQLVPERDARCRTSVPGVFAAGDCCGMGGAPAAVVEGRIAGRAAARAARGVSEGDGVAWADETELARHRRFQAALWQVFSAPRAAFAELDPETMVCRCEEIRVADIAGPAAEDGTGIGGVKRATRVGMGRCQGRYCAHVVAPQIARARGQAVDERAFFAPRVPVKPVAIADIMAAAPDDG